jgi:hypothetical protein
VRHTAAAAARVRVEAVRAGGGGAGAGRLGFALSHRQELRSTNLFATVASSAAHSS